MPLISIIVVTWNNESFIEQAITSCLDSRFTDYEVIIINNGSTDRTSEVIRSTIIGKDNNFKIIENVKNEGPGEGRNIGIHYARGEYLMFLDGDDWFEPGAISQVATHLSEKEPDVLIFNHQRVWESGLKVPNLPNKYTSLGNDERDLSLPCERQGAMRNLHSSSNKAYRRQFIEENGISSSRLYYEDVMWSFKAMIKAETCYFIPQVIFNYRQRWGSITRSSDDRHFDIFKQARDLIELLNEQSQHNEWYGIPAYQYIRSLLFGLINTRYRVPKSRESEYLDKTSSLLFEWRNQLGIKKLDWQLFAARTGSKSFYFFITKIYLKLNKR